MTALCRWGGLGRTACALAAFAALAAGCSRDRCNNECPAGTTCDQSLASCIPNSDGGPQTCTSDTQCTGLLKVCNAGGLCVQCVNDSQCPAGVTCDVTTDTCATGCQGSQDCASTPTTPVCDVNGVCVECTSSLNCTDVDGMRRTCDPGTETCVLNPCKIDSDCESDPSGNSYCLSGACVACLVDMDCPTAAPHCSATNTCVACNSNSDCNQVGGQTCVMNECVMTGCGSDSDCQGGQQCNTATHACVSCLSNADCNFGGVCTAGSCVQPASCTGDAQCLLGTFCGSGGTCVMCRSASDCPTGQTCRSSDGTCQPPSSNMCTDTSMCGTGETCSAGACTPATCVPTSFGMNYGPSAAATLPSPGPASVISTYCPNTPQYFVLQASAGDGVQVTLTPASAADFALELVPGPGPSSAAVQGQTNRAGKVIATIPQAPAGTNAVMVIVSGDVNSSTVFTLDSRVNSTGLCEPDPRQPDGTQMTAFPVPATTTFPITYPGTLCGLDQQWFAIDVPANQRPVAALTSTAGPSNIELAIYTVQNGVEELDSYDETTLSGAASVTAVSSAGTGGQDYYVAVMNGVETPSTFNLRLSLIANPPPNNACVDALPLTPGVTAMGTTDGALTTGSASCGGTGGDVFYKLEVTQPSQVQLNLEAGFDAVLSVSQACNDVGELGCAGATAMAQQLSFQALTPGTYLVRVAGADPSHLGPYSLTATVSAAPSPTVATCDAPLPLTFSNGSATASGNIALAANDVASTCGQTGGDAVYVFSLTQPQKVDVALTAFPGAAVSLVSAGSCSAPPSGQCVAVPASGSGTLTVNAVTPGDYVLVIDGGNEVAGQYSFTITLSDPIYPPPNETCATAIQLAAGTSSVSGDTRAASDNFSPACGAAGGQSGDTVYSFSVSEPSEVVLQLAADYDAAMELTGSPCGGSPSVECAIGGQARIRQVVQPGDYYVWVDGYDSDSGTFTLSSTIQTAAAVPTNQSCATAQAVDLSAGAVMISGSTATASASDAIDPTQCVPTNGTAPLRLAGPNVVYSASIPAGMMLEATLNPAGYDGAIYITDSCSDATCLAAADNLQVGGTDTLSLTNSGTGTESVYVVVGSWDPSAWGTFTLSLQLQ